MLVGPIGWLTNFLNTQAMTFLYDQKSKAKLKKLSSLHDTQDNH